jgi:hypothetical protein
MNSPRPHKEPPDEPAMSLEELAKRMLAMPAKPREEMSPKKKAKPRKKKA